MTLGLNDIAVELRATALSVANVLEAARAGGPLSPEADQAAAQAIVTLTELANELARNDVSDYATDDTLAMGPGETNAGVLTGVDVLDFVEGLEARDALAERGAGVEFDAAALDAEGPDAIEDAAPGGEATEPAAAARVEPEAREDETVREYIEAEKAERAKRGR